MGTDGYDGLSTDEVWDLCRPLLNGTGLECVVEDCVGSQRPADSVVRRALIADVEEWASDDMAGRQTSPREWVDAMCEACGDTGVDCDRARAFFETACANALRRMATRDA